MDIKGAMLTANGCYSQNIMWVHFIESTNTMGDSELTEKYFY